MLIYDCEIIKAIPGRNERETGIEYCAGWHDHANMGVSVVGAYDYATERYRVFCEDNLDEWLNLSADTDLLIGFNNLGFDDKLLNATWGISAKPPRYDLLAETWIAAGHEPTWQGFETHGGYGLDAICKANFGQSKTGNGALAPVDWQRGKIATVIDYCLADVWLTKKLFDRVLMAQPIMDPKTHQPLTLMAPRFHQ